MNPGRGQARTGEIKRMAGGWAIRYRDGRGVRRQKGGFRTKAEAKTPTLRPVSSRCVVRSRKAG